MPKTLKEFEDFAAELVSRHVVEHGESKHYKAFIKALIKAAVEPLGSEEVKDLETCLAGVRADKIKVGGGVRDGGWRWMGRRVEKEAMRVGVDGPHCGSLGQHKRNEVVD